MAAPALPQELSEITWDEQQQQLLQWQAAARAAVLAAKQAAKTVEQSRPVCEMSLHRW